MLDFLQMIINTIGGRSEILTLACLQSDNPPPWLYGPPEIFGSSQGPVPQADPN